MKTKVKNEILKYRKKLDLTLVQVASISGVSKSQVHDLQYGKEPRISTARSIAKALNSTVDKIWPSD